VRSEQVIYWLKFVTRRGSLNFTHNRGIAWM